MNVPHRLLVVMDPIDHIKYQKDTTLALLLAAQRQRLRTALRRALGPVAASTASRARARGRSRYAPIRPTGSASVRAP